MFRRQIQEVNSMADDKQMDAIKLLTEDHRTVEGLFEQFEKAEGAEAKRTIVQQICTELKVHAMLEEEIFYPAIRGKVDDADLDEAYVEHDGAKMLINELEAGTPDEDFYDAKVKVLQEQIEHHVKEEERQEGNLFAQTRKSDVDLEALGREMAERKQELMRIAEEEGLPPAEPATMHVEEQTP
jgi:hemerythrin superfamily protein